mmetsp:Transcript_9115/g.20403  ORF Transcript_9115/g.20403 Transcript_9115/m.20403 type:complete len:1197 (+) Transcript_9115:39-3629(+)
MASGFVSVGVLPDLIATPRGVVACDVALSTRARPRRKRDSHGNGISGSVPSSGLPRVAADAETAAQDDDGGRFFELRAQELENLSSRLESPNVVVTAAAFDLLRKLADASAVLRDPILNLGRYMDTTVYSEEVQDEPVSVHMPEVSAAVEPFLNRVPFFVIYRRQQKQLELYRREISRLSEVAASTGHLKSTALRMCGRMQQITASSIVAWLWSFWRRFHHQSIYVRSTAARMQERSAILELISPFFHWRIWSVQQKIEHAHDTHKALQLESSILKTEVENMRIEYEYVQRELETSKQAHGALMTTLDTEKAQVAEWQDKWVAAKPVQMSAAAAVLLEYWVNFICKLCDFQQLQVQKVFLNHSWLPLIPAATEESEVVESLASVHADNIVLRWVNFLLLGCRRAVAEMLDSRASWSSKEAPLFRERVKLLRHAGPVRNFDADLQDGVVLVAVVAKIRAEKERYKLRPHDLWPLDEKDLATRATLVVQYLREVSPMRSVCLAPSDLTQCTGSMVVKFLAQCMILAPSLPSFPGLGPKPVEWGQGNVSAVGAQKGQEEVEPIAIDWWLGELASRRVVTFNILRALEDAAGSGLYNTFQDPGWLLSNMEDLSMLASLSVEQLLLRWVNLKLADIYPKKVQDFGEGLKDGTALFLLLHVVAGDVMSVGPQHNAEQSSRSATIVRLAPVVCDAEFLTEEAINEGHADLLAAFLCNLFATRPSMKVRERSPLANHLQRVRELCGRGMDVVQCQRIRDAERHRDRSDAIERYSELLEICAEFTEELEESVYMLMEVKRASDRLRDRCAQFAMNILYVRNQGDRVLLPDGRMTLPSQAVKHYVEAGSTNVAAVVDQVNAVFVEHASIMEKVGRRYAYHTNVQDAVIHCVHNAKLRSKWLPILAVEDIFGDIVIRGGLQISDNAVFRECILAIAAKRFPYKKMSLPEKLRYLLTSYLTAESLQDVTSFHKEAYGLNIRGVVAARSEEIKAIFSFYCTLAGEGVVPFELFVSMLKDGGMLDTGTSHDEILQLLDKLCKAHEEKEEVGCLDLTTPASAPSPPVEQDSGSPSFQPPARETDAETQQGAGNAGAEETAKVDSTLVEHAAEPPPPDIVDPEMQPDGVPGSGDVLCQSDFQDALLMVALFQDAFPFVSAKHRVERWFEKLAANLRAHWTKNKTDDPRTARTLVVALSRGEPNQRKTIKGRR